MSEPGEIIEGLDGFLLSAIKIQKDKIFLLKLDRELEAFILDKSRDTLVFPQMNSYQRRVVHRIAAYFKLTHNLHPNKRSLVLGKTDESRIPVLRISDFVENEAETPVVKLKIMQRNNTEKKEDNQKKVDSMEEQSMKIRLEEKAAKYKEARDRIFNNSPDSTCSSIEFKTFNQIDSPNYNISSSSTEIGQNDDSGDNKPSKDLDSISKGAIDESFEHEKDPKLIHSSTSSIKSVNSNESNISNGSIKENSINKKPNNQNKSENRLYSPSKNSSIIKKASTSPIYYQLDSTYSNENNVNNNSNLPYSDYNLYYNPPYPYQVPSLQQQQQQQQQKSQQIDNKQYYYDNSIPPPVHNPNDHYIPYYQGYPQGYPIYYNPNIGYYPLMSNGYNSYNNNYYTNKSPEYSRRQPTKPRELFDPNNPKPLTNKPVSNQINKEVNQLCHQLQKNLKVNNNTNNALRQIPNNSQLRTPKKSDGLLYAYSGDSYDGVKTWDKPSMPNHILELYGYSKDDNLKGVQLNGASIKRIQAQGQSLVLVVCKNSTIAKELLNEYPSKANKDERRFCLRLWVPPIIQDNKENDASTPNDIDPKAILDKVDKNSISSTLDKLVV